MKRHFLLASSALGLWAVAALAQMLPPPAVVQGDGAEAQLHTPPAETSGVSASEQAMSLDQFLGQLQGTLLEEAGEDESVVAPRPVDETTQVFHPFDKEEIWQKNLPPKNLPALPKLPVVDTRGLLADTNSQNMLKALQNMYAEIDQRYAEQVRAVQEMERNHTNLAATTAENKGAPAAFVIPEEQLARLKALWAEAEVVIADYRTEVERQMLEKRQQELLQPVDNAGAEGTAAAGQ